MDPQSTGQEFQLPEERPTCGNTLHMYGEPYSLFKLGVGSNGGEVGLFWRRMASRDFEPGSELSCLLWICTVCIIQFGLNLA